MTYNLAILSPNQNAYSETFIQAHKNIWGFNIKFYYGGYLPNYLEGEGYLRYNTIASLTKASVRRRIQYKTSVSIDELALLRSFQKEKVDCVLAEYGPTGVAVMEICKLLNIPLIVHFHGFDASMYKWIVDKKLLYNKLFEVSSYVIAVSQVMKQNLAGLGCPDEKLIFNPYGPNARFCKQNPSFSEKLFVGIGRFVDKKAPYYTILAFKQLLKDNPDAKLIIAGDGPLWETCRNLVNYYGMEDSVILPKVISSNELSELFTKATAFVQHSIRADYGDMEGTPVAVLEASAAGLPVISTKHAGINEVVVDGFTGLLVNEHDVNGMANAMRKLLEDRNLAKKMGEAGRERIKNNYSLNLHLSSLRETILRALSEKRN